MRLFIAINFDEETKDKLWEITQRFKDHCVKGNFTRRENFHLTVVFIGETSRVATVRQVMDRLTVKPFSILMERLGRFQRKGGDIYWIGVKQNKSLVKAYNQLHEGLVNAGFDIEDREFKPHMTLGREVVLGDNFDYDGFSDAIPPMTVEVNKISLMKSERINGKLVYTEIYAKPLY